MVAAGQGAENLGACFNSHGRGGLGAGKLKNAHPTRMAVAGQGGRKYNTNTPNSDGFGRAEEIKKSHPTRMVMAGQKWENE